VATEYGELVEVGCINAKHDFIIGEHMLGRLPEHAPPGQPLGTVTLVGAGPGDPDLLTVAAYKALQAADVVVADRLVSQEILELVQGDLKVARKLPVQILESALYLTVAVYSKYTRALTSENCLLGLRARGAARNLPVVRRGRAGGQECGAP
jgi:siroheme synthase